ncbi:MAG: hypothetical protein WDA16_08765 [Candidatus Thermoplasmatota archaeon]
MSVLQPLGRVILAATLTTILLFGARAMVFALMPSLDASQPAPTILLAAMIGGAGFALALMLKAAARRNEKTGGQ